MGRHFHIRSTSHLRSLRSDLPPRRGRTPRAFGAFVRTEPAVGRLGVDDLGLVGHDEFHGLAARHDEQIRRILRRLCRVSEESEGQDGWTRARWKAMLERSVRP